jgi:predicted metalloenzyme YecM
MLSFGTLCVSQWCLFIILGSGQKSIESKAMTHPSIYHEFVEQAATFGQAMLARIKKERLEDTFSEIDHICYRVETQGAYQEWKDILGKHGHLLTESSVGGRPISVFKLSKPIIISESFNVNVLELPSPKDGSFYREGFEHIEVVTTQSLQSLLTKFPDYNFKTKKINDEMNADISLQFDEGCVKFHEQTLEAVVDKEKLMALNGLTRR